jgi:predicted TIM-barrel fold metal-dependent hydrolase
VFGTGQPLRIPENSIAKLDLLDLAADRRAAIESTNARKGLLA